jgi:AcrR family transcriptional regulator
VLIWLAGRFGDSEREGQVASGGESLSQLDERAGTGTTSARIASPRIAPLYKRLPHGPHRLTRDEVIRNQRTRIHGAMIETIAQDGYEKTSIKKVVALAGLSRRAFYEQFANKEECFLTTFDLLAARAVKRTNEAYRAADGALENRLRAAFEQFAEEVSGSSNGATLIEAPMAGAAGMLHLCRATATFEQMLLRSFAHAPEASDLPLPVVRGIVGGLYEVMSVRLRTGGRAAKARALTEELLRWTLLFGTSAPEHMAARLAEHARVSVRSTGGHATNGYSTNGHTTNGYATNGYSSNGHSANGYTTNDNGHSGGDVPQLNVRDRLLECTLRLTVLEDYEELSVSQIADEAGVSIDSFFECFEHKQECFLAAFDEMSDELLTLTADPELVSDDWPPAVHQTIGALMRHLADHPLHAQMIATGVYATEPEAIERNHELVHDIATLLTEGAPAGAGGTFTVDAVAGAIWHTVRCQVAGEQIQLLPALTDYVTYVVLTPFIGAEAAAELVMK